MFALAPGIALALVIAAPAQLHPGALDPNHVALVFNRNSRASGELALFYAEQRALPPGRMIALDLPPGEDLPRERYEPDVAEPIRRWLTDQGLTDQIACLVTFYDVPIRVGKQSISPEMRAVLAETQRARSEALEEYEQIIAELRGLATPVSRPATTTTSPATRPAPKSIEQIKKTFQTERTLALRRASQRRDPIPAADFKRRFLACMERAQGMSGILASLRPSSRGNAEAADRQLEKLRATVKQAQSRINELLAQGPLSPNRSEARQLIKQFAGLIGLLAHLDQDVDRLRGADTIASLDSELSTLWAPPASLYRWRLNTLNARHRANEELRRALPAEEWQAPILMVSRLDGPSPNTVRRIIEDAVPTEKVGLTGRAYIDARGLAPSRKPGSYGLYDQDLRDLARLLQTKTKTPTILDNHKELFPPAACPDAALYCGWYSVARFQDAFMFVRGAVAVHIASFEAKSLRDPKASYWCKELLADGAAATFGPVDEPYLSAFPMPRDFFGLLATGRYTLVECFYYTKPYNSWMMLLVGDPLYRPFAVNPQLAPEDVLPADILPLQPVPTSRPTR
ncbi:MAG: TIGR03790 family protein [Phycisphaerae bacterium]|nr:TIGR03790 family protein [Phycisphaerae bacterium]